MSEPGPTERLVFRTWRDDDQPLAQVLFGDNRVTALVGGPFVEDKVRARLALEIATHAAHGYQYWPMFLADGTLVGCCGLRPRAPGVHERGYFVRPEQVGSA